MGRYAHFAYAAQRANLAAGEMVPTLNVFRNPLPYPKTAGDQKEEDIELERDRRAKYD